MASSDAPNRRSIGWPRRGLAAVICAAAVFAAVGVPSEAATVSEVGVVINHDSKPDKVKCVRINGTQIRAIDLLSRTPYPIYTRTFGTLGRAVCWLDGEGYFPKCFSSIPTDPSWGVWLRKQGQRNPQPASEGVSTLLVPANGVLHMVFDSFSGPGFTQPRPAAVGIQTICGGG